MKPLRYIFILSMVMLVLVAGCAPAAQGQINVPAISIQVNAPGASPLTSTANENGQVAGVLLGLWHGIIAPVTLVIFFPFFYWQPCSWG